MVFTSLCVFCDVGMHDRMIADNEFAFSFLTQAPIVPGHVLICPKRHVQTYDELRAPEKSAIEQMRKKIKTALKKVFRAQGFNYAWNEGEVAGQSVPHFHLHVVPRKKGDIGVYCYEPREFLYRPGIRPTRPDQELKEVSDLIRRAL